MTVGANLTTGTHYLPTEGIYLHGNSIQWGVHSEQRLRFDNVMKCNGSILFAICSMS